MRLALGKRTRELGREVAIIVLGVLIALGINKIVERGDLNERRAAARFALKAELTINVDNALERRHISGCVRRRLDEIGAVLDQASITGRLPRVRNLIAPPFHLWPAITWDAVVASQTASLLPVQELNELALVYGAADDLRAWSREESAAWTSLSLMVGRSRPLSPFQETHLREALARAKILSRMIPAMSGQLEGDVRRTGVPVAIDSASLREGQWGVCRRLVVGDD